MCLILEFTAFFQMHIKYRRKEGISMEYTFCTDTEAIHKLNPTYEGNPYEVYPRQMNVLGRRMQQLRLKKQAANYLKNNACIS